MKKLISLISALAIAASLVCPAYAAETEESGIYSQESTTTIATAKDFDLSSYSFIGDTMVEVEYDFSNSPMYKTTPATEEGGTETTTDLDLNIPFVFKSKGAEVVRFSIIGDGTAAKNVSLHRTKFGYCKENGSDIGNTLENRSGFVARKGKLTFLFSQTDKRLYAQYTGDGIKTAGYMGWAPFTYVGTKDEETETTTYSQIDTTAGLTQLTVGASNAPAVDLKIKAYSVSAEEAAAIKKPYAKYTYESDYTGAVSNLYAASSIEQPMDFKVNTSVSIEKDAESDNHYAKVSSAGEYKVMLAPQYRGIEDYTDYTFIKYKQYIPEGTTTFSGNNAVTSGKYGALPVSLAITATNKLKFKNTEYTLPESMVGKWTEIMFVYCPSAGTVSMYADGKRYATESYGSNTVDEINTISFKFDNDTYIDDLEMGEYIPTLADKTFETTLTWTAGGGKDVNIPAASQADQMIIEAEYNFVDKTVSNLNIPVALRNGSSELGRYSIQQKTTTGTISDEYFESTFNQSNNMDGRGGLVGRKGTVKILADTVAGKFWVKYVDGNTNGLKTEQYMGCGALDLEKGTAINLLNVGAGGTPVGTTIALKVYPADEAAVTEFKKFKTAYKYDSNFTINNGYLDFKASTDTTITVKDGMVNVPAGKDFSLMLTPQFQGYEGKFTVSYKLKNANADGTVVGNVFTTNYGETNGATRAQVTQTNTVAFAGLLDGSSVFGSNNTSGGVLSSQMPYTLSDNEWHEYKQTIDLVNHTADYYVDGWYCGTRTLNEATKYVNQLKFTFSGYDVQIDDITVENYTDDSVKNTAKLYVADEKVTINEVEYTNYRVWASYVDVNAADDAAMSVFAASYLDGKLVNISVPTATMGELTNRSTKNAVVSGTDVDEVRGFLWRNSDLKPLTDLVKVTITQAETSAE